jgi:hypothetical protein
MENTCLQCGGLFAARNTKLYCSRSCSSKYHRHHPRHPELRQAFNCLHCGCEFRPRVKKYNKFCSRTCSDAYIKQNGALGKPRAKTVRPKPSRVCLKCNKPAPKHKRYCDTCRPTYRFKRSTPAVFECGECGTEYVSEYGDKRRNFCSARCGRRFTHRLRKAREKVATPDRYSIEKFGAWEIYRRDRFMCQLCGERVNLAVPYFHAYAPTIDHIVPLSKGGKHKRDNVQCAHHFCNSLKSNKDIPSMFFAINNMGRGDEILSTLHS